LTIPSSFGRLAAAQGLLIAKVRSEAPATQGEKLAEHAGFSVSLRRRRLAAFHPAGFSFSDAIHVRTSRVRRCSDAFDAEHLFAGAAQRGLDPSPNSNLPFALIFLLCVKTMEPNKIAISIFI
jgi:hypothetical protein